MSQFASKDDLIATQAARIAELESELEAVGAGGVQRLSAAPQPCSRSHPHEEMTPMCEMRTEIARMTNALARSEAQLAAAPQAITDEREAFVNWLHGTYPNSYSIIQAADLWFHKHVAALAWKARAAIAAQAKQGGASHG